MHINHWQYLWHRKIHQAQCAPQNYVPHAFGAFYNHPFEGFLLDTLGIAIAERVACLCVRQAIFFFVYDTGKAVDGHCEL